MKYLSFLSLLLAPTVAFAHEGHGDTPVHLISGVVTALALAIGIAAYRAYTQEKE